MPKIPLTLSIALVLLLSLPSWAANIYIGNQPYQGRVTGTGSEIQFVLSELAEALSFEIEELEEGWALEGKQVATKLSEGLVWVELSALPSDLVRVVQSRELNTVDLYRVRSDGSDSKEVWTGNGTMVYFYAEWSYPCIAMENTIASLEQSSTLKVARLNIDQPNSPVFKRYVKLFEGDRIPFYVLLDSRGRKLDTFSGVITYPAILEKLKAAFPE